VNSARTEPQETEAPETAELAGSSAGEVREVAIPYSAQALTALSRVDYTDAFLLSTPRAQDRTGEQWARAMLEEAPPATRTGLRRGWFALGVRLGSADDPRRVLGWRVRESSPDHAVLAADSLIGMEVEVLFKPDPSALLVATIMRLNNPFARVLWAAFSPQHRRVVCGLLKQTSRRAVA